MQTGDGVREPQNRRVEITIPQMAAAPTNEVAYCAALSASYRLNVGNSNSDAIAGDDQAQCAAGNSAVGIPVLERILRDARVTLPPRA